MMPTMPAGYQPHTRRSPLTLCGERLIARGSASFRLV